MRRSRPLPGWWAKILRGEHHRNDLKRYVTKTLAIEKNKPTISIKFDRNTREHVLYVKRMADITRFYSHVGILVGDCVHNLRAALDHLVYEMAFRHTNGKIVHPDRVKFPITDRRDPNVWRSFEGRELGEISRRHRAMIKRYQPFKRSYLHRTPLGPDYHPLSLLRDLSDMDKHRLLTTVVIPLGMGLSSGGNLTWTILANADPKAPKSGYFQMAPAEQGAELARAKLDADAPKNEVEVAAHTATHITFGGPFRRPLLPVLDSLGAMVVQIVRDIEPTL